MPTPFTWLAIVGSPTTPPVPNNILSYLATMVGDCLPVSLWHWQFGDTASPETSSLIHAYTQWCTTTGERPQQEDLDWWLANWHQSHISKKPEDVTTLGSFQAWEGLSNSAVDWLWYGLARLARQESGVMLEQPSLSVLRPLAQRCSQQPSERLLIVWAVDGCQPIAQHQAMVEQLTALTTQYGLRPIQVVILDDDKQSALLDLPTDGPFRQCGRLSRQAVYQHIELTKVADVLRRMNLPATWLPAG